MHHVYIRFLFCILSTVILLQTFQSARADIYQWEWIDSAHPELGKRESLTLCPNGAGVSAVPNTDFDDRNLTRAYFLGANVANAYFDEPTLTDADFTRANLSGSFFFWAYLDKTDFSYADLSNVSFNTSYLGNAIFTNAILRNTWLLSGFTKEQLYSTASYKLKDLTGVQFGHSSSYIDFSDGNFANQSLTGASFFADFSNANFSDAIIRNAGLFGSTFTKEQLYSTASYKNKDLTGISFPAVKIEMQHQGKLI
jgi:uncharacterized protein YjbI with pentapeptide repeats